MNQEPEAVRALRGFIRTGRAAEVAVAKVLATYGVVKKKRRRRRRRTATHKNGRG